MGCGPVCNAHTNLTPGERDIFRSNYIRSRTFNEKGVKSKTQSQSVSIDFVSDWRGNPSEDRTGSSYYGTGTYTAWWRTMSL